MLLFSFVSFAMLGTLAALSICLWIDFYLASKIDITYWDLVFTFSVCKTLTKNLLVKYNPICNLN